MRKRKILIKIFFILMTLGIPQFGNSQINDENIRLKVLHKNVVGKEFVFGKWSEKGGTETSLTYLGILKTNKGRTYKIMNYIWTWGMSYRSTSRILVFNDKNQYLGNYYAPTESSLPKKIKDGILIFANKDHKCDKKIISKISFKNGLPKEIYVACNNTYGYNLVFDGTN
ncbi:hypothetical protein [Flavobacterium ginsenosidimutans]|uniref:hypothetical protein n=1 Tax=Flavobacterium ginsenosidimutans TaxID=687844 RepID=UPI0013A63D43|nr:hypothetical protein [Flavobacterium ginsenosidimutans]KAF2329517.1 hypothetical protein DM444_14820 [Flavobacterium ginsenosidimutans]